jgi:hypothetical protein
MAGKTIINQNIIDRVIEHTLKGISIESVCALSNIRPRSYHRWLKQGKEDIENGVDSILAVLAESVLAAEAKVEQRLLDQAIGTDPIGARWYLSRKFRKEYGDKQEIEISGDIELVFVDDE